MFVVLLCVLCMVYEVCFFILVVSVVCVISVKFFAKVLCVVSVVFAVCMWFFL